MKRRRIQNKIHTALVALLRRIDASLTVHDRACLARGAIVTGYAMTDATGRVALVTEKQKHA